MKEIENLQLRRKELEAIMSDPGFSMSENFIKVSQEYNETKKILDIWEKLQRAEKQFTENEDIIKSGEDPELAKIAEKKMRN